MSLCRFWWDGSDVYVYYGSRGLECCGCRLEDIFYADDERDMAAHLDKHVDAGHVVPVYAYESLGADHPDPAFALAARDSWRLRHPEHSELWGESP